MSRRRAEATAARYLGASLAWPLWGLALLQIFSRSPSPAVGDGARLIAALSFVGLVALSPAAILQYYAARRAIAGPRWEPLAPWGFARTALRYGLCWVIFLQLGALPISVGCAVLSSIPPSPDFVDDVRTPTGLELLAMSAALDAQLTGMGLALAAGPLAALAGVEWWFARKRAWENRKRDSIRRGSRHPPRRLAGSPAQD